MTVLNYLITTSIGTDKIAVMDGTGKTFIFNEDKGKWEGMAFGIPIHPFHGWIARRWNSTRNSY